MRDSFPGPLPRRKPPWRTCRLYLQAGIGVYHLVLPSEEAAILDAAGGPVVAADAAGRIAYMNAAAAALFGWTPGDAVGQPLTILMPERMHDAHRRGIRRYLSTRESRLLGRPTRVPALRKDGTEFEIELVLRLFRRPDGSDLIVGALIDVTGRVAQPNVLELETRLQKRAYQLI